MKSADVRAKFGDDLSLPTRGAWIEILKALLSMVGYLVAPHTGSVD